MNVAARRPRGECARGGRGAGEREFRREARGPEEGDEVTRKVRRGGRREAGHTAPERMGYQLLQANALGEVLFARNGQYPANPRRPLSNPAIKLVLGRYLFHISSSYFCAALAFGPSSSSCRPSLSRKILLVALLSGARWGCVCVISTPLRSGHRARGLISHRERVT